MFQTIFKAFKNGQNRFGRSDKSTFGRFGRFMKSTCKSLILKAFKADKKTDRTPKNISKHGRQNPYRGFGVAVNVRLGFLNVCVLILKGVLFLCEVFLFVAYVYLSIKFLNALGVNLG